MKTLFTIIAMTLLLTIQNETVSGAVWDTNSLYDDQYDEFGIEVNSNKTVNGETFTNYTGSGTIAGLGFAPWMPPNAMYFQTNFVSHASFTVFTNGHIQVIDQYGFTLKTGTNAVWSITAPNGLQCQWSNFNLTISSNGNMWGTVSCSNFQGTISDVWVTNLAHDYPTRAEFLAASNFLYNNNTGPTLAAYMYGTNFVWTNLYTLENSNINAQILSESTLFAGNLLYGTNFVWTNLDNIFTVGSNSLATILNANITTAEFACSNNAQVVSNAVQGFAVGVSNMVVGVSNFYGSTYGASLNTISNNVNTWTANLTNDISTSINNTTNGLAGKINGSTNDFYNGPTIDYIQSYIGTINAGSSSPATVSLTAAWPSGSYAVFITPLDQNTANFLSTNKTVSGSATTGSGYYINNQNGTGWQLNFFQQVPSGFNLNFMVLCQYYYQ